MNSQKKPNLMQLFNQSNSTTKPKEEDPLSVLPMHMRSTWNKNGKSPAEILYEEIYKDINEQTHSRFKEKPNTNLNISAQDFKCWTCQGPISEGFWGMGSNCEYCFYSGRWHCNQCLSDTRMPIPWRAMELFDLRHYKVSQLAQQEIQKLYEVPILQVAYDSPLVRRSKTLFEFLVLKRQIHLLYNTICDIMLMQSLFEKKMHLCLKQNLFSLKDLYDIYNGSLYKLLEGYFNILNKHVLYCKSCQKKGEKCGICQSIHVVHAFDIRNIIYCENCNHLYHRACFEVKNCPSCLVNTK